MRHTKFGIRRRVVIAAVVTASVVGASGVGAWYTGNDSAAANQSQVLGATPRLVDGTGVVAGPSFPLTPLYLPPGSAIGTVERRANEHTVLYVDRGEATGMTITTAPTDSFDREPGATEFTWVRVNGRDAQVASDPGSFSQLVFEKWAGLWVSIVYYGDLPELRTILDVADMLADQPTAGRQLPVRFELVPQGYEVVRASATEVFLRTSPGADEAISVSLVPRGAQPAGTENTARVCPDHGEWEFSVVGDPTIVLQTPGVPEFDAETVERFGRGISLR